MAGRRLYTLFVYLNSLPAKDGGCTIFTKFDLKVQPEQGAAVLWSNHLPNGDVDVRTMHRGEAPKTGTKYGMNIWVRESVIN